MNEAYKKLIKTLRTLFEMDKADLDFGIYRILNQKRDEISRFLDEDLLPQVKSAFADYAGGGKAELQAQLEQAIEQAKQFGAPDPEQAPPVLAIKAKLASAVDITAVENEVYSHLHTFFSRYYDQGDFISQRRYKADTYAIPYEGEEVKLYWANHDQYYVKSSEHLRDYAFTVHGDDGKTVRIKLVEADTEKDNVKAAADQERRFVLDAEQPLHLEGNELQIRFHYVPSGRKKQDALNAEAVATIFAQKGYADWLHLLRKRAPTEAKPDRTLLEKHLNDYTARNTFDYFIHKNLGGFLRRELDFYIKSEVLHLDDVDDAAFAVTEAHLRRIRVLRSIAHKIIRMLDQIEDFQKRLWLKKKFVVETTWLVRVGCIPKHLHAEILANSAQCEEWAQLLESKIAPVNLDTYPTLFVDTRHFPSQFVDRLLGTIPHLEEETDGVLFHSDSFQALNLMRARYMADVSCVYIDPPYNTGNDGFVYKDQFQHSCWLSLIQQTVPLARRLLETGSSFFVSSDDNECGRLRQYLDGVFGEAQFESQIVVQSNKRGQTYKSIAKTHEYLLVYDSDNTTLLQGLPRDIEKGEKDEIGLYELWELRNRNPKFGRHNRPNLYYPIYASETQLDKDGYSRVSVRPTSEYPVAVWPLNSADEESCWRWSMAKVEVSSAQGDQIVIAKKTRSGEWRIWEKARKEFKAPKSIWLDSGFINEKGTVELGALGLSAFAYPKPLELIKTVVQIGTIEGQLVLDFFAGTGTTAHAVIQKNREDDGKRKFSLVEMGDHFRTVLIPRVKMITFTPEWKGGVPKRLATEEEAKRSPRILKIIRLESYEDALNNLLLRMRSKTQEDLLDGNLALREDYMLGYWLDVETADSPSLLNVDQFGDPFSYKLNISTGSVGAFKPTVVDLVETFNYLIGLRVKHIDSIRGFKVVTGTNPQDESVLVIWRKVKEQDNAALEAFMDKQGYNPRDTEFDRIYVNGDHTLEDPHSKVKMTEIEFKRLMFDVQDV